MAYRDEVGAIVRENDEIRRALAKARFDARFTAMRQVVLVDDDGLRRRHVTVNVEPGMTVTVKEYP